MLGMRQKIKIVIIPCGLISDRVLIPGEIYFHLNRPDLAEAWYKKALSAKPDHVPAHLTYARFLYKQVT